MREQKGVMLVKSESEGTEEAGAKWRAQNPCSNSAEPEQEGGLVAICVSQPVNHVYTPPGQDVFQYFFQRHITPHTHLFHAKCQKCVIFFLFVHIHMCKSLPKLMFFKSILLRNLKIALYSSPYSVSEPFKYVIFYTIIIYNLMTL